MTLKRSLHQISKTTAPTMTKSVRFSTEEPMAMAAPAEWIVADHHQQQQQLWYTGRELATQLDDSTPIAAAIAEGFSILLQDSYEHPHVNVQEYLNAFVAAQLQGKETTWRGLEQRLEGSHREERSRARSAHVHKVLLAQASASSTDYDLDSQWERLAHISRQSSAASKLFAMRLGRADARAISSNSGGDGDAAREIVLDHQRREEYRRRRTSPTKLTMPSSPFSQQRQQTPKIKA